jgi:hypothetical protein
MIDANALSTPIEVASRLAEALRSVTADSLPEYTAPTRLSPIVLIDKRVLDVDAGLIKALLQTLLSVYSAHYLQAINMELNVGDVNVTKILDKFSTDRDVLRAAGSSNYLSMEALSDWVGGLPDFLKGNTDEPAIRTFGSGEGQAGTNKENIANIMEDSNLAVGKVLEVKVFSGEHTISIPVTVTVMPKVINSDDIVDITAHASADKTWSGRWHAWRSGEIRFVKDYLLCLDLIEGDRKALMADKTGTLLTIRSKRTKGILAALVSGRASPNAVSTMVVVSKQTAEQMEFALKGKLKNHHTRDEYFKSTTAMMLVVVDTTMERFSIYQRGIADVGMYTLDDIKMSTKKGGVPDIESIMKAYKLGEAPTL